MELTYSRDERQMIDWLGAGKYAMAFFVTEVEAAAKQGLPIPTLNRVSSKKAPLSVRLRAASIY